ncbi:beta-mannosidase [Sphaerotilus hippei]|uniref:Beta-mannosidase n=2 Tax=Sphaerotilus hippei TaxID=744406 RepID=A0A318H3J9_9BURK|nr:beta-mannosidase [Sphaerotilus hippei]
MPGSVDEHGEPSPWRLIASAPGQWAGPDELPATGWQAVDRLGTVAAMLRGLAPAGADWSVVAQRMTAAPVAGAALGNALDAADWWMALDLFLRADELAGAGGARLELDGLATLAEVWLDGRRLLDSRNMFVAHAVPLDGLTPGRHRLVIVARSLDAALQQRRPRPRWRAPMIEHQQLRWWRTSVLGRTPGWSPPAAPVGAWRDVRLVLPGASPGWQVGPARLQAWLDGAEGRLDIEVPLQAGGADLRAAPPPVVELLLTRERHTLVEEDPVARVLLQPEAGRACWRTRLRLPVVDPWWPHTHGEPALYRATLRLDDGMQVTFTDLGCIGFRRVEVDTDGGDFRVRINGQPVFCRGACWTPLDVVGLRATPDQHEAAVAQVCATGMNMVRVAGTMVYEEASFHAACDRAGLMVWQEFMFANMDFPHDDEAWRRSVETEARQQLGHWQSHPCVVLVCGNSEVGQQAAMWGAPRADWEPALFHETLPALVGEVLPGTPYWPSSAHGGAFPHAPDSGTTSAYAVGAYLRPLEDARRLAPRFATECLAFANVPPAATLSRLRGGTGVRVTHPAWKEGSPRDLGAGWDFDDVRDHYLELLSGESARTLRYSDHDRYLMLSRITTAEVMAAAMAEWRLPGSACRGALVWWLRDLRPGAGWGLLDDRGLPKSVCHALRRVLQPQAVLLADEGHSGLVAHVINEGPQPLQARLRLDVWRQRSALESLGIDLELAAHGHAAIPVAASLDRWIDLTWAHRFGPRGHEAVSARLLGADGRTLSEHWHFPGGLLRPGREAAQLQADAQALGHGVAEVTLRAETLCPAVHFDVPGWVADDEFFHLAPGETRAVRLRAIDLAPSKRIPPLRGCALAPGLSGPVVIKGGT